MIDIVSFAVSESLIMLNSVAISSMLQESYIIAYWTF